jgi:hypothetical protein
MIYSLRPPKMDKAAPRKIKGREKGINRSQMRPVSPMKAVLKAGRAQNSNKIRGKINR